MRVETRQRIDASNLPRYVTGPRAVGWWGVAFLVVIELMVFGSLVSSYFYLAGNSPQWPQDGLKPPELLLPTITTLVLLAGVIPMAWGVKGIQKGSALRLKTGLVLSFLIGATYLVLKYVEYSDLDYTWATNAYASIVWTMIGFHSAHVLATLLFMAAVFVLAQQGYFREDRHVAVQCNALYWYFICGSWPLLYVVLYWSPRWL
ncbi:MAG: heme-copper oxidase subunit III [Caldilineaceae bacterium]|nr:heme-copper oxidase subunit III [Caldilineaceae bacterium]